MRKTKTFTPTFEDYQNLSQQALALGRGDLIHRTKSSLGLLHSYLTHAKKKGSWTAHNLKDWRREERRIRSIIVEQKLRETPTL
jgi:hypothetical protein